MTTSGLREQRRRQVLEVHREHLLDAAEVVFGTRGYEAATVKEIAERAEFSVGAVYGLVDSKEDLLLQTLRRRGEALLAEMEALAASVDDGTGAGMGALHRLVDLQIRFFRAHPEFGRLWLRRAGPARWGLSPESVDRVADDFDRAMELQAGLIRRAQAAGAVRAGDADVLARVLSAIVQAYQATDPASVGEGDGERLPSADLHALVEGAFAP